MVATASAVMIASSGHPDNLSLAGDGFDTVIKAKAAVDAVASCKNKVSCADILTMATRDVVVLAGGPSYAVELGRLDGLSSTSASVGGNFPKPNMNLDQLNRMFAGHGLTQADMIALPDISDIKEYREPAILATEADVGNSRPFVACVGEIIKGNCHKWYHLGPPGTGKTQTILGLLSAILHATPVCIHTKGKISEIKTRPRFTY